MFRKKAPKEPKKDKEQLNQHLLRYDEPRPVPKSYFQKQDRNATVSGDVSLPGVDVAVHEPTFEEQYGYSWDLVIVFPFGPNAVGRSFKYRPDEVIRQLNNAGLQTYLYYSVQRDEILCKIRATTERLGQHADVIDYKMLLDEDKLRDAAEWGMPEKGIAPIKIAHDPRVTRRRPHEFIYGKYDTDDRLVDLYAAAPGLRHPFGSTHRIKLLLDIISSPQSDGGCHLNLKAMQKEGSILAFYPLHDVALRADLDYKWLSIWRAPWNQPLDDIRNYFGEKVGLYFTFLGHYTTWLVPLSILGTIVFFDVIAEGFDTEATTVPYFCLFVAFWAVLMLENWKRKEATVAMEWGMSGFEEEQRDRPEFKGEPITSFVNGKTVKYYPPEERRSKIMYSIVVIFSMVCLVVGAVAGVFVLKLFMSKDDNPDVKNMASTVASLANALQIQVMNFIYGEIAEYLTKQENHRTDTQYEDSLIAKLFAFQFVNSYSSLVYIAFIKKYAEDECDSDNCMTELCIALAIIFGTRLISGNASELIIPRVKGYLKMRKEAAGVAEGVVMSRAEVEYSMETFDEMMGTLTDFAELSIQFGYVTLFVTAFPLAPLLACISNYFEIRTDGHKLLHLYRRVIPTGQEDIGTWQNILTITAVLAVISNAGLVCFTMTVFEPESEVSRVWYFIMFQYMIFVIMAIFSYVIEDIPDDVVIQLQRREFLVQKIIDCVADDTDDFVKVTEAATMHVHEEDDEHLPAV